MPWSGQPTIGVLHVSLAGLYRWGQTGFVPGTPRCPPFQISLWEGSPCRCEEQRGTWASCFPCKDRFVLVVLLCQSSAPLGSAPERLLLLFSM